MYLNKAILIGNLTKDPELKSLPSGIPVCSFTLATNRVWKDKNGAKQESADYHYVVVFGKQANSVSTFLRKGSQALVMGRLQTRSWDDQSGAKRYRTEVIAENIQFGSRPVAMSNTVKTGPGVSSNNGPVTDIPPMEVIDYPTEEISLDDIPF